ncbi:MAG TPA: DUF3618 domain-containing protein [Baekduia sp.]|uniref:DUF3618 domain-containing protein n=1 Tax=Baekduia sp. TaxID=2600305 RepID=UPI002D781C1B|nr:DUF3618 domain-containing protein [Baekduia sp.]HET6510119.1 DUF3618 domain-containing protein [Baekduia sp.]
MNGNGARTPEEIRAAIEHTREELADTAAALAEKADVKTRAHEKVEETRARFNHKVEETRARVTAGAGSARSRASGATPESVADGAQQAAGTATTKAKENPIPVALAAGFAAGLVIGRAAGARRR